MLSKPALPQPLLLDMSETNKLFRKATNYSLLCWAFLVGLVYYLTPPEELVYLSENERRAASIAFYTLSVATLLLLTPFVSQQRYVNVRANLRTRILASKTVRPGVLHMGPIIRAAVVCQSIAVTTNALLAFFPVVVKVDAITWSPVYLIRWCEWVPLAGLMTFLSEGIEMKQDKNSVRKAIYASLAQSISCFFGGFICAFCPEIYTWSASISIAVLSYLVIFPRLFMKRREFKVLAEGNSYLQRERYDRLQFSYNLLLTCTVVWTVLVGLYCTNAFIHRILPPDHYLRDYAPAMIVDTFFDVLAKALYMRWIVDVHFAVFDAEGKATRQLSELRCLMALLWDTSSDVIVISVKVDGKLLSIFSPAFTRLVGADSPDSLKDRPATAIMIELSPSSEPGYPSERDEWSTIEQIHYIDSSRIPYQGWIRHTILGDIDENSFLAKSARSFVNAAWTRSLDEPDIWALKPHSFKKEKGIERQSEIKVSKHGPDAIVSVIRDVTERYRWFDAERRAHAEVLRRQKEAQSQTRFVRHEVKNGLLAGIELCDTLRNEIDTAQQSFGQILHNRPYSGLTNGAKTTISCVEETAQDGSCSSCDDAVKRATTQIDKARDRISDLDMLLHEVLETVLAEAMARDVIHEVYKPRYERLDVAAVLQSSASTPSGKSVRFPISANGALPFLQLDPQLLRYIHRNAVSNAIKYGKSGGKVHTVLSFDPKEHILQMQVINEASADNVIFARMDSIEYNRIVFSQGTTLHDDMKDRVRISSGDGAWIMQSCAKTLGGTCSIQFDVDKTVFTFVVPAEPLVISDIPATKDFVVPPCTIGIAIDDSNIQRKLMARIFTYIGIEPINTHVLGEEPSEIMGLKDLLFAILESHPNSNIILLMDENLDYGSSRVDTTSVVLSGSLIMQGILADLSAEQESRVLALVRSANDSTEDVARYAERTHGFFPKAPMQKERVREIIAPLWAEKFLSPFAA